MLDSLLAYKFMALALNLMTKSEKEQFFNELSQITEFTKGSN